MPEQLFYNRRGIQVTANSFCVYGHSYPLSSIQNVNIRIAAPNRRGPLIFIIVGILLVQFAAGVLALLAGIYWLAKQKPTYWLVVSTEAGGYEPFHSKDLATVKELHAAMVAAIAHLSPLRASAFSAPTITVEAVETFDRAKDTQDPLMIKLLRAAEAKGGRISVTQGVMATGASFSEVEAALKAMVKTGYVEVENDPVTGVVLYDFRELSAS